jgi:3',5'-cyclic AMP phosphodiesterase CpdA
MRIFQKYFIFISVFLLSTTVALAGQDQQIAQKLAALEKIQRKFTFVVIGDNRSGDDIYRKLVALAMERKADFMLNTGDLIATPGDLKEWAKFWKMSKPITVPYFLTVGNHDAHSKVPGSEQIYKQQVGLPGNELYYSFVAGNSFFVVLDSSLDDQEKKITGEQYTWLEEVLAHSIQKHKFVFVHHPLYTVKGKGKHAGNSMDRYPRERDRLQALFVKYHVELVFTGHEHLYERKLVERITHVISGGGGAPLYADEKDGGFNHFIVVTVDGDKVTAEVVDSINKVRDRF